MATSGSFIGSTSNQYITPKIEWSCVQNVAGNYSDVTADLYYKKSSSSTSATSGTLNASLSINGSKKKAEVSSFNIPTNNTYQKAMSYTVRVPHNSDGSKSVEISCTGYISGTTLESTTCKSTIKLTAIPRASTITAPSTNVGDVCKIAIKRASTSFMHTLEYTFGNLSGTIATKTTSANVEWTIPDTFYNEMKNVKNKSGTISCITYNGDTEIGTSASTIVILISDENAPSLNPKIYVTTDSDTYKLTGSTTKLIRYYTFASYEINAVAKNGASIISQKMSNGDLVYTEPASKMDKAINTNKFLFTAEDSRGYVVQKEYVADMVEYIQPSVSIENFNFTTGGNISFLIVGNYYNGSFGKENNSLNVQYRYAEDGGEYGTWTEVNANISENRYEANVSLQGLNYLSAYKVQARITDKIKSKLSKEIIFSCVPVFDWGKSGFKFNVPVSFPDGDYLKTSSSGNQFSGDADELFTTGLYRTNKCTNAPSDNGFLFVFSPHKGYVALQIGCDFSGGGLKYRTYWYGTWYEWKTITIS